MASRKRIVLCYILLQASFWGMISSICAYQAAIVLDRGFTTGQAGIFCALCYLASLFTQPVIGGWADRHPSVPIKRLLIIMLLPAAAAGSSMEGIRWKMCRQKAGIFRPMRR